MRLSDCYSPGTKVLREESYLSPIAIFPLVLALRWTHSGPAKPQLRSGAGIFWGSMSEESWLAGGNTIPYAIRYSFVNISITTGSNLLEQIHIVQPSGNIFPYTGGFFPVAGPVQPTSPGARWPYTMQMNMSIQQQLTNSLALWISYVGSLAKEQPFAPDLNYPSLSTNYGSAAGTTGCAARVSITATTANVQCRRPFQPFGTILQLGSPQNSSFHSLQANLTKRMAEASLHQRVLYVGKVAFECRTGEFWCRRINCSEWQQPEGGTRTHR